MAMEKVNKLIGVRGGERMYAVLTRQNDRNKRGSGGRDGGEEGDRSKRPRQVKKTVGEKQDTKE